MVVCVLVLWWQLSGISLDSMMELIISTGTEEIGASHTQNIAAARAQTHVKTMERKREREH